MKHLGIFAVAAILMAAPLTANAAPCSIGTCTVTGSILDVNSPIGIDDAVTTFGAYAASGQFGIAPGIGGADAIVDISFDSGDPVPTGFRDLRIDFFQGVEFLASYQLTDSAGRAVLQEFILSFDPLGSSSIMFALNGVAFQSPGIIANPDYNINISASTTPIPVPGALPLLLSGIAGLGFASRRNKKNGSA